MDQSHRLLLNRIVAAWCTVLSAASLAACRPAVASINLVNGTTLQVDVSVELAGGPDHAAKLVLEPNARYFLLKYEEHSEDLSELTKRVKSITFEAPGCMVTRRGDGIRDLVARDPDHAGWLITFRAGTACRVETTPPPVR